MSVSEEQKQSKYSQWLIQLKFILMCRKRPADRNIIHHIHVHSEATNSPVMNCKPRHGRCRWVTALSSSHEHLSVVWMNQAFYQSNFLKRLQSTTQPDPPPKSSQTESPFSLQIPVEWSAKAHHMFPTQSCPSASPEGFSMLKDPRVGALSLADCSLCLHNDTPFAQLCR